MEALLIISISILVSFFITLIILNVKCPECRGKFKGPPNKNPYRRICENCGRQEDYHDTVCGGEWIVMNRLS